MQYHTAPFRIGRSDSTWDTQSTYATIVGILVSEHLQIAVEYAECTDEIHCYMGVSNCVGWQDLRCDQIETTAEAEAAVQAGTKLLPDPLSDLMFVPEIFYSSMSAANFASTELVYDQREGVSLGPSGYTIRDGLYMYPDSAANAWAMDRLDLLWLGSFRSPQSVNYFAHPQAVIDAGIEPEFEGCTSEVSFVNASMAVHQDAGWSCNSSWWLTRACVEKGVRWTSECVVMFEDSWGYTKPALTRAVPASGAPIAKLFLGYDQWRQLIVAKDFLVVFTWFSLDATFAMHHPRRVGLIPELDTPESVKLKAAWRPALDASTQLTEVLTNLYADNELMNKLMPRISEGYAAGASAGSLYQKVACDWLRGNKDAWEQWLPSVRSCTQGQFFNEANTRCEPCAIGTYATAFRNGTRFCKRCPAGRFSPKEGLLACSACPGGKFQVEEGRSACSNCAEGTSQAVAGQTACVSCTAGFAAANTGSLDCSACAPGTSSPAGAISCSLCEVGTFAATMGSASCAACLGDLTTLGKGAASTADCVCPPGSYRPPRSPADDQNGTADSAAVCDGCPEGLLCLVGSDAEVSDSLAVLPGYMTRIQDPLRVFKCMSVWQCPGGALGTCGLHRDAQAVACGVCQAGAYEKDSQCRPCDKTPVLPILLTIIGTLVALGCAVIFCKSRRLQAQVQAQVHTQLMVVMIFGLTFSSLQTISLINTFDVTWPEPLASVFQALGMLAFDLKVLRLSCVLPTSPVATFTFRQSIPVLPVPFIGLALLLKKQFRPATEMRVEWVNAVGTIYNVFFISILISCTVPFVCYTHPAGNGASVLADPSILCFQSAEHRLMVSAGAVSFVLIPLPFLVFSMYGIGRYRYHASRAMPENVMWLRHFRFLFSRFTPEAYYYGLVLLARNCFICLVPVVLTNAAVQICAACLVITAFTLVQQQVNPWRSRLVNLLDGFLNSAIINILICGAMAGSKRAEASSVAYLGIGTLGLLAAALLGAFATSLVWHLRAGPQYDFFLCHHKEDAQAQARLLKIRLQSGAGLRVFLDSDDLVDLQGLFDIVRGKMRTLLVYLTRFTLTRPWCAGEITSAFEFGRQVVVIRTPSFLDPTHEELENLSSYIDVTGCNLAEHSLTLPAVAQALRRLLGADTPCVQVAIDGVSSDRFQKMFTELRAVVKLGDAVADMRASASEDTSPKVDMLVISVHPRSNEAWAAAAVLLSYILADVLSTVFGGIANLADRDEEDDMFVEDAVAGARAVIVLLNHESLQCTSQLKVMSSVVGAREDARVAGEVAPAVIPVSLPGFEFPSAEYYQALLPKVWPDADPCVAGNLKAFFQHIGVSFPTGGSEQLLLAQSRQVLARIPTRRGKLGLGPLPSSAMSFSASMSSKKSTKGRPTSSPAHDAAAYVHAQEQFQREREHKRALRLSRWVGERQNDDGEAMPPVRIDEGLYPSLEDEDPEVRGLAMQEADSEEVFVAWVPQSPKFVRVQA